MRGCAFFADPSKQKKRRVFILGFLDFRIPLPIFGGKLRPAMPYVTDPFLRPVRCRQCGEIIDYGRSGRTFCCAACKNKWHNLHRLPDKDKDAKRIIRILNNNRELLLKLLDMRIHNVERLTLLNLGYNLNYFTSVHKAGNRLIYGCLDISYELTPTRMKKIRHLGVGVDSADDDV